MSRYTKMFVEFADIHRWMTLKYDSNRYKNKSLTQNVARLCVKKNTLKKISISDVREALEAFGADLGTATTTYIEFALPFSVKDVDFCQKMLDFSNKLKSHMYERLKKKIIIDDNLQTLIIKMLKNRDYKLQAAVHHAAKFGASSTFEILEMVDREWSLRC